MADPSGEPAPNSEPGAPRWVAPPGPPSAPPPRPPSWVAPPDWAPPSGPPSSAPPPSGPPDWAPPSGGPPSAPPPRPPSWVAPPDWAPPSGGPPTPPPRRTGLIATVVVVAVLALAGGGVALWALVLRSSGPSYPSAWDPQVADLATKVESLRELKFEHPVYVDFLTPDEFRKTVTRDASQQTEEQRAQADQSLSQMRALGLVQGDVNLTEQADTLTGGSVLALYDPETKRIRVNGTQLDEATKVTVVHEMTHALQDQHFDLQAAAKLDKERDTSTARAVVEGDAVDVERAYVKQLPADERKAYEDQSKQQSADAQQKVQDVPDVLQAFFVAPYALGPSFVGLLHANGGYAAVNAALGNPPASEAQIIDPMDYFGGRAPLDVPVPSTTDGQEHVDDGTFGALAWYLVLSERIDPLAALSFVDDWGGDSYVSYREAGRVCMRMRVKGQSEAATGNIGTTLDTWAAAMPNGSASVARSGDAIELTSCDPGASADLGVTGRATQALGYPATRLDISSGLLTDGKSQGVTLAQATCVADKLVRELSLDELRADELSATRQSELQALAGRAYLSCR